MKIEHLRVPKIHPWCSHLISRLLMSDDRGKKNTKIGRKRKTLMVLKFTHHDRIAENWMRILILPSDKWMLHTSLAKDVTDENLHFMHLCMSMCAVGGVSKQNKAKFQVPAATLMLWTSSMVPCLHILTHTRVIKTRPLFMNFTAKIEP